MHRGTAGGGVLFLEKTKVQWEQAHLRVRFLGSHRPAQAFETERQAAVL